MREREICIYCYASTKFCICRLAQRIIKSGVKTIQGSVCNKNMCFQSVAFSPPTAFVITTVVVVEKKRKHAFNQESDQEKKKKRKKTRSRPRKLPRKKLSFFSYFLFSFINSHLRKLLEFYIQKKI